MTPWDEDLFGTLTIANPIRRPLAITQGKKGRVDIFSTESKEGNSPLLQNLHAGRQGLTLSGDFSLILKDEILD
jgi:hypothetical protein